MCSCIDLISSAYAVFITPCIGFGREIKHLCHCHAVVSSFDLIKLRVGEENVDTVTGAAGVCALGSVAVPYSHALFGVQGCV